jgi:hypothetical protein
VFNGAAGKTAVIIHAGHILIASEMVSMMPKNRGDIGIVREEVVIGFGGVR